MLAMMASTSPAQVEKWYDGELPASKQGVKLVAQVGGKGALVI